MIYKYAARKSRESKLKLIKDYILIGIAIVRFEL